VSTAPAPRGAPGAAAVAAPAPARDADRAIPGAIGILGGTFDPPHIGHLAIAEEAREALGLARVLFLPAGDPWQKAGRAVTPAAIRVAMVEAAVAGNPAFAGETCEVERTGPTYTVETLADLATRGVARDPWFILSAEALAGFATWRSPERVLGLARLAVVPRGPADPGPAVDAFRARFAVSEERLAVLDGPRLDVSSSALRARVRAGRSIRYLVPAAVAALVAEYALYATDPAATTAPADR
jgi:nicotinate-nucleotide adenylyltransferase